MDLAPRIIDEITAAADQLRHDGHWVSDDLLNRFRANFRQRFGPEVLASLDGELLLETMHGRAGQNDSLAYWLEFKNDDEFSAAFGSIAGGSALKFGIFQRKETGEWTTGSSKKQVVLSRDEAIDYVRDQRDQLLACVELAAGLPSDATMADYVELQSQIDQRAPLVAGLAWAHKYVSLICPETIDDIHSVHHQHFHLIRLLQQPPDGDGKYVCGWYFAQCARKTGLSMQHLTSALYRRSGQPHWYWRIGAGDGTSSRSRWDEMRDGDCIAIGWEHLGDLSEIATEQNGVPALKDLLSANSDKTPSQIGRIANQIWAFIKRISERDVVAVMDGSNVLGIARVTGDYYYIAGEPSAHRRPVKWLDQTEWRMANPKGLRTAVAPLQSDPQNRLDIERHLLQSDERQSGRVVPPSGRSGRKAPVLDGVAGRIQSILDRKSQVILYGPPGTGKTYWAERTAFDLASYDSFGRSFEDLTETEQEAIVGSASNTSARVRFCCFHPAYGYEDFLEGYRPQESDGQLAFTLKPGVFRRLCGDAAAEPQRRFYLIIDEINRGDIPRIFGELMTVLERDKRGKAVILPLTGQPIVVPANVYVIGTMNTADRSIALLDTALRRRFGFIELMPDTRLLAGVVLDGIPVGAWLAELNNRICQSIGSDARNLQIGHSYLMEGGKPIASFARFARVIQDDILPLLEEYCYEDYEVLQQILGKDLIGIENQRISHDLFDPSNKDKLIQALLAPCPDISRSSEAVDAETTVDEEAADIGDDDTESDDDGTAS